MDAIVAYLHDNIKKNIYLKPPKELIKPGHKGKIWKLWKSKDSSKVNKPGINIWIKHWRNWVSHNHKLIHVCITRGTRLT